MTDRHPPRLALALLERLVPDSEPLAGDLVEAFERRPSVPWFWIQVVAAVAATWRARGVEIRPLRLVDDQPADALERTRRFNLRFPGVNLTASPLAGVSGLGLAIFAALITLFAPAAWGVLSAAALAGGALGALLIVAGRPTSCTAVVGTLLASADVDPRSTRR
jgi:hypothetical protein